MSGGRGRGGSPWSWREWDELLRRVRLAYEDIDSPRRAFVRAAVYEDPYRGVVADVRGEAQVVDDTDVNCDVCFTYLVGVGDPLVLRLSMVGPYAMLERVRQDGGTGIVAGKADCSSHLEAAVLRVLLRHGLLVMSAARLAAGIELALPDVDRPTVHNALFTPEDDLQP